MSRMQRLLEQMVLAVHRLREDVDRLKLTRQVPTIAKQPQSTGLGIVVGGINGRTTTSRPHTWRAARSIY